MNFPGPEIALSGPLGQELRSLDGESDPELYFRGLLDLGRRLTQRDEIPTALQVFHFILNKSDQSAPDWAKQAQGEIDAIEGRGALGKRAEFLSRRLFHEAANPSALLGMAGAQAIFSLARTTLLFRLAAAPSSLISRGFGARALASTGAFAAEAPSFVAFSHLADSAIGKKQDESGLVREIASSFLSLGALKLAGWAASSLARHEIAVQASMFGGILMGHRLEELAQLRPVSDGATALLDSFATLFQFNLAGRILQSAGGEGWTKSRRELQLRVEGPPARGMIDGALGRNNLALARGGKLEPRKFSPLLMMSKADDILASAPPSVKGLIEGLRPSKGEPDTRLFNLAVTFLLSKGRHGLTAAEKSFLRSVAEHQLAEYEKGLDSYYLPKLIYNSLHDFKGLERIVKLMRGRNYDKYTALMNLEKYDQAFESVDIGGFGSDVGTDIVFHKLASPMFRRLSEMSEAHGYPKLIIQPLSRTALDLLGLSSSYDLIVAIAKGGMLSGMMAKFLNLPVKIVEIHAHDREIPSSKWIDEIRAEEIAGKRILLVDKDTVSGASIREALRLLKPYQPSAIGAYFNYGIGEVIPAETAQKLSNEGVQLHFPGSGDQSPAAKLYYYAHEQLGTPLGRFRRASRELAKLKKEETVQGFIDRQQKAFFSLNPFLPGVEEVRSSMASRLEVIAQGYQESRTFDEIRARRHLVELLRSTPTLPDYFASELARGRYHSKGLELAAQRSIENSHIPHSYVAAFHSAQKAVKNKYDVALIVGPEGFAYEPIFRDLGMKTIAVNIPEADYGGKRSIEIFDHLGVLRNRRVLVVEDDVQSGATLAKLLEEIQPYEPRELGLYLGLPAARQMEGNIPPAFKKVYVTDELSERESTAFLRHLKEREVVFKYPPPK